MIDAYEKIIMTMRNQSSKESPFALGVMDTARTCKIGALSLDDDDLYKLDGAEVAKDDTVLLAKIDDSYIILGKVVD